jgi:hypothetical protein
LRELEFEFIGSGCFWPFVDGSELDQVAHRWGLFYLEIGGLTKKPLAF